MEIEERILSPETLTEEVVHDAQLRPKNFQEYIGQKKIVKNIEVMAKSAKLRNTPMDHILLSGPPGLGKTSLAVIIAKELNAQLHIISGPAIEKKGDIAAILTNLTPKDVLFIDEIHRMSMTIEEILYSAMEDFRLDIIIGQGAAARTMQIDLSPFTLIGATTKAGLLSGPLRDRFLAHLHFDFYKPTELATMIRLNAEKLNVKISKESQDLISHCSRGTPRLANRILRRVRDFSVVSGRDTIEKSDVEQSLELMEVDRRGLDRMDRKILRSILELYNGGPVGIDALCASLGEDRTTIEDVYEPYLLKEGLLLRGPRGRSLTEKAREILSLLPN